MSMHYGIWHEAWQTCCRYHNIEWSAKEDERCSEFAKRSYYQTHDANSKALVDVAHELGRRANMHPDEVSEMIKHINKPPDG